jgi:hypothetical protein
MFDAPQSWKMSEPEKVLTIIKEIECWRLGNWDGCLCSRFSIRNVDVEISCGKGRDRGIWVSSASLDYMDVKLLHPIAEEVQRQVEGGDHRGHAPIYLHEPSSGT